MPAETGVEKDRERAGATFAAEPTLPGAYRE
jgi:hypothetical protein